MHGLTHALINTSKALETSQRIVTRLIYDRRFTYFVLHGSVTTRVCVVRLTSGLDVLIPNTIENLTMEAVAAFGLDPERLTVYEHYDYRGAAILMAPAIARKSRSPARTRRLRYDYRELADARRTEFVERLQAGCKLDESCHAARDDGCDHRSGHNYDLADRLPRL